MSSEHVRKTVFTGKPWVLIWLLRPWALLAVGVGVALVISVDWTGGLITLVGFVILGALDMLWSLLWRGVNRVIVRDSSVELVAHGRTSAKLPIEDGTRFEVRLERNGLLEWFSAAYPSFGWVREVNSGSEIEFLIRTEQQRERLEGELNAALHRQRAS